MDLPVLVDSNVYIDLLRKRLDPSEVLPEQFSQLDLVVCGMVRVEVLRGIRVEPIKAQMKAFFDVLQNIPTDNRLWEETVELAWALDRKGIVIPAQDIVIACCARRISAVVLTMDSHYRQIPGVQVRDWPIN
jgi:predicted nucleic acid-binding protein